MFSEIFELYSKEIISHSIFKKIIEKLIINNDYDYFELIESSKIDYEKVDKDIESIISENMELADQITSGFSDKISVLVSRVIAKTGKEISGKYVKKRIQDFLNKRNLKISNLELPNNQVSVITSKNDLRLEHNIFEEAILVKEKYRTHLISGISMLNLEDNVTLAGWVSSIRDHGEIVFIDLRDTSYEIFQIRLTKTNFENIDYYAKIPDESVISVQGVVIKRDINDINSKLRTGELELDATKIDILNLSKQLPFEIRKSHKIKEEARLKYKFLDHRNFEVRQTILNRHSVIQFIRNYLSNQGFIEIETPILSAGTEEGAREYVVPVRKFEGSFYSLPQSPQQYKQMLICSGYDKYFQIARCFRDEDSRGDRQPEFTQIDLEMAFVSMQDIISLNTALFNEIVINVYENRWKLFPFKVMTYKEALLKYGTDRPDLRFGLEMADITEIVSKTNFNVFY